MILSALIFPPAEEKKKTCWNVFAWLYAVVFFNTHTLALLPHNIVHEKRAWLSDRVPPAGCGARRAGCSLTSWSVMKMSTGLSCKNAHELWHLEAFLQPKNLLPASTSTIPSTREAWSLPHLIECCLVAHRCPPRLNIPKHQLLTCLMWKIIILCPIIIWFY